MCYDCKQNKIFHFLKTARSSVRQLLTCSKNALLVSTAWPKNADKERKVQFQDIFSISLYSGEQRGMFY